MIKLGQEASANVPHYQPTTTTGFKSLELRSILGHRSCSNRWARTESRFVRSSSGVFYLSRWDVVGPGKCRVITSRRRKRAVFRPGDEDRTKNGASGSNDWRMRFATGSDTLVFEEVILLTTTPPERPRSIPRMLLGNWCPFIL